MQVRVCVFGKSFDLIINHKPLETIFGPKSKPCARIERWVLRLQSYRFNIIHRPGKSNIDPLSRLCSQERATPFNEQAEHYVNFVVRLAVPTAMKLIEITEASKTDPDILGVKQRLTAARWESLMKMDTANSTYKSYASEFCFVCNILLRGTRIVMPKVLR